uniref:Rib_recp_KP_reg domain-containing protein n=1 Tax=Rhabditophanes sp. KR3021 TaxID=114890 RepID=A0AC35TW12_9BILA
MMIEIWIVCVITGAAWFAYMYICGKTAKPKRIAYDENAAKSLLAEEEAKAGKSKVKKNLGKKSETIKKSKSAKKTKSKGDVSEDSGANGHVKSKSAESDIEAPVVAKRSVGAERAPAKVDTQTPFEIVKQVEVLQSKENVKELGVKVTKKAEEQPKKVREPKKAEEQLKKVGEPKKTEEQPKKVGESKKTEEQPKKIGESKKTDSELKSVKAELVKAKQDLAKMIRDDKTEKLKAELESLRIELFDAQTAADEVKRHDKTQKLESELLAIKEDLANSRKTVDGLRKLEKSEGDRVKAEKAREAKAAEEAKSTLQSLVESLKSMLLQAEQEISSLKANDTTRHLEVELQAAKDELIVAKQALVEARNPSETEALQNEVVALKSNLENVQRFQNEQTQALQVELESLNVELTVSLKAVEDMKRADRSKELEQQLIEVNKACESKVADAEARINSVAGQYKAALVGTQDELEAFKKSADGEKRKLEVELEAVKVDLQNSKKAHEELVMGDQTKALQSEVQIMKEQLVMATEGNCGESDALKAELESLRVKVAAGERVVQELEEAKKVKDLELEKTKEALEAKEAEVSGTISNQESAIELLKSELTVTLGIVNQLRANEKSFDDANQKLKAMEIMLEERKEESAKVQDITEKVRGIKEKHSSELSIKDKECSKLRDVSKELITKNIAYAKQIQVLKTELAAASQAPLVDKEELHKINQTIAEAVQLSEKNCTNVVIKIQKETDEAIKNMLLETSNALTQAIPDAPEPPKKYESGEYVKWIQQAVAKVNVAKPTQTGESDALKAELESLRVKVAAGEQVVQELEEAKKVKDLELEKTKEVLEAKEAEVSGTISNQESAIELLKSELTVTLGIVKQLRANEKSFDDANQKLKPWK